MKCDVAHKIPGRIRFTTKHRFFKDEINILKYNLECVDGVSKAYIYKRTGSILVHLEDYAIRDVIETIEKFDILRPEKNKKDLYDFVPQPQVELFDILRDGLCKRIFGSFFPGEIKTAYICYKAFPFFKKAIQSLYRKKLSVDILDALSIFSSMYSRNFSSAGNIIFLLNLGGQIEDWVYENSREELKNSISIHVDEVFIRQEEIKKIPLSAVQVGDEILIEKGSVIPIDGCITEGEAMVNQSTLTGEPLAIEKVVGCSVLAGTTVEEGRIFVKVRKKASETRLDEIIQMLQTSEKNKSVMEKRAENQADSFVKFAFAGTALTYALTRNFQRAKAFLMVDFSCALKLSVPIAVMSAIRDASDRHVFVKGGKYLENLSKTKTIVFDKTGTLTNADPKVQEFYTFGDLKREEVIKYAACLEEHFPHSVATAVIEYAKAQNIAHREMHTEPEYIVAHGIRSTIEGKEVLIGSDHFILEDENISITEEIAEKIDRLKKDFSLLYFAFNGKLESVIAIADPIREESAFTINSLRSRGFTDISMITGDSENAANHVATLLQLDSYRSGVLPDEKSLYIQEKRKQGLVAMVGDGINDSVALLYSDVGISMYKGADIAKETSDMMIHADDLSTIVDVVDLSRAMTKRVARTTKSVIGFNSLLITCGALGWINPQISSLLHNVSTVVIAMANTKKYLIS